MCGGIASGFTFMTRSDSTAERLRTLLSLQVGRVGTYAAIGGLSAATAAVLLDPFASATSFRLLQWLGAAVLMWVGLTMAGVLPRVALAGEGVGAVLSFSQKAIDAMRGRPVLLPVAMGVSWALTPCPMVYAALFTATLTGSFALGAAFMLAFGAGTVPAVLGSAFGITTLARYGRSPHLHLFAGIGIAGLGLASILFDWSSVGLMCVKP